MKMWISEHAACARADQFSKHLSIIFAFVLLLIFTIQYFIHRSFVLAPIKRFKNKALAISKNEALLGQEISLPVSREFGELALAFNSMSLKMRYQLDHLEEMVGKRTTELKSSNDKL